MKRKKLTILFTMGLVYLMAVCHEGSCQRRPYSPILLAAGLTDALSDPLLNPSNSPYSPKPSGLPAPPKALFASPQGPGKAYIGWRMVSVPSDLSYNVYRATTQKGPYEKITSTPIKDSTNYTDDKLTDNTTYFYVVTSVDPSGRESQYSLAASVTAGGDETRLYLHIKNIIGGGSRTDTRYGVVKTGDMDGDGLHDYMFITREATSAAKYGSTHIFIYHHDGSRAVDIDLGHSLHPSSVPWTFWDLTGDGREELIGIRKDETGSSQDYFLYIKNGRTGETLNKVKVPSYRDTLVNKTVAIAFLDGVNPYILYQEGTYPSDRNILTAYPANLDGITWQVDWPANKHYGGSHQLEVADIDGDGKDEVFHGAYCIDDDGSIKWSNPWRHVDGVHVGDIIPGNPGLEVFFHAEQTPGGIYVTDKNGKVIWEHPGKSLCSDSIHAHHGWIADVRDDYPGMELWVKFKKGRSEMVCPTLLSSSGKIIDNWDFSPPVDWTGGAFQDVGSVRDGQTFRMIDNLGPGYTYAVDLIGDYREEIIKIHKGAGGALEARIYTNTRLNDRKKPSPWEERSYAQKRRWAGH